MNLTRKRRRHPATVGVAGWIAGAAVAAGWISNAAMAAGMGFTDEQIGAGKAQYDRTCAQCHGRNMVNSGTTIYDLRKFPVEDPERFRNSVTQGKGNMPSFKEALLPEQIAVLWAYVGTRGGKEP